MRITVAFLFAVLAVVSAQEFGARLKKLSRTGRIGQSNGYFYPEPSPSFTLPTEKPTTTTRRPTTAPVVQETQPPVDYLPPTTTTTTTTTRRPTTTARSYVQCSIGEACAPSATACSNQNGRVSGNGECLAPGGQAGVCCRPIPTTTQPPTTTTTRATTTTTRTTTTQRPVTTTPSLEYLPPTTTKGYNYEVPENPLFPDNSNNDPQVLRPTTTTTRRPQPAPVVQETDDEIAFWDFRESIPGEPEIDYPIFDKIPETSFTCSGKIDGFYADIDTRCQVFHVCVNVPEAEPIKNSFLCPNGTLFHQESFACQWWPDVECATSANFFSLNENIGKVPEPAVGAASSDVRISAGQISASASASSSTFVGAPVKSSAAASNAGRKY